MHEMEDMNLVLDVVSALTPSFVSELLHIQRELERNMKLGELSCPRPPTGTAGLRINFYDVISNSLHVVTGYKSKTPMSNTSNEGLLSPMIVPLHEVDCVDMVHDPSSYKVLYLFLALLASDVKRRVHVLRCGVHRGTVLQQEHYNVDVTQPGCNVERSLLLLEHSNNV